MTVARIRTMLGLVWLLYCPLPTFAQGTGVDELQRQLGPAVTTPYLGANLMERYNYHPYTPLYLNWNSRQFYTQEYLDRMDRLEKFGDRWPSAKYGTEFQVNRIQNAYAQRMEIVDGPRPRVWFGGGVLFGRFRR